MSPIVAVFSFAAATAWADSGANDSTNALGLQPGGSYGYNLTGKGVTVGIFEAGDFYHVRRTHNEFRNPDGTSRVTTYFQSGATTSGSYWSSHATGVASVLGGSGAGGSQYRGAAPEVTIRSYGSSSFGYFFDAHGSQLDITNHSYSQPVNAWDERDWVVNGTTQTLRTWYDEIDAANTPLYRDLYDEDPRYGRYSSSSRSTDILLHENPNVLAFYSAGNGRSSHYTSSGGRYVARFSPGFTPVNGTSLGNGYWLVNTADYASPGGGYDGLVNMQTSKNAVIVGSMSDYITDPHTTITDNLHSSFTNYGPTDEGRLGVTVMAPGESLQFGTNMVNDVASDTAYASGSGTSYSSPSAAGTAALLLQHWRNKTSRSPTGATQKALLIHTATDMASFGQVGPDFRSGYGLINALDAAQFIDEASKSDATKRSDHFVEGAVATGTSLTFDFFAVGGPLEASLVWNDVEGLAFGGFNNRNARALINDLDVWISDAAGKIYFPWTLNPDLPGNAAVRNKRNDVDNIENVLTAAFAAGEWFRVHVGVDGRITGGTQAFSLLISGGTAVPEPATLAVIGFATIALLRRRRA